jgi:hypothetical protein
VLVSAYTHGKGRFRTKDLCGQVFEDGGAVDGGLGTDTHLILRLGLQVTVDTTDGELLTGVSI